MGNYSDIVIETISWTFGSFSIFVRAIVNFCGITGGAAEHYRLALFRIARTEKQIISAPSNLSLSRRRPRSRLRESSALPRTRKYDNR